MQTTEKPDTPSKIRPTWHRIVCWLAVAAVVVVVMHYFLVWALNYITEMNSIDDSMAMRSFLIISLIVYAILIAIPFMPGIEVGVALLLVHGADAAPFVYLATVCGLLAAYMIGNRVPMVWFRKVLSDFGLQRACRYLDEMETMTPRERLNKQRALLPNWLAKLTTDYRYATIGVLLNLPGTFAIGGGGGILMAAGFSRLFNSWYILATLMIGTLPVPLIVWLVGASALEFL